MNQALAERPVDQLPIAPAQSESAAILSVIERMATNPEIDPDRIERFIALKERMDKETARKAFAAALAEMQAEMPEIEERGQIDYGKKNASAEEKSGPTYALWEDINAAIKPVMAKHGFALSFRTGQTSDGKVTVTGILSHREGHQEETTMVLMHDSSGGKNAVQAIGSSTSYGKRYAASALLNLTTRDGLERDDDGESAVEIRSKAPSREIDKEMRAEIDACATVEELERLWKSKPFQTEFERHPKDWQKLLIEHFNEAIRLLKTNPPRIDPKGQFDRMEREAR